MENSIIKIAGMSCGGCTSKVTAAIKALPGINSVDVSLGDGTAQINFDPQQTSINELHKAIENSGFVVNAPAHEIKPKNGCCCA